MKEKKGKKAKVQQVKPKRTKSKVRKDSYKDICITTGLVLGVIFGILLSNTNGNFVILPLCIILGMLIGATVGTMKKKRR